MKIQIGLSVVTAYIESLFFSGVLFGFPSLQFVLEKEGYFGYLCKNNTAAANGSENTTGIVDSTCGEQEASFNLAFTLGLSLPFVISFVSGYVLDKFGTWIQRSIMTTLYTLGYILLTISSPSSSILVYPALIFIGVSGFGQYTSNCQVANFFKSFRGVVLSLLHGFFDSSVLVFLLVKKAYDSGINLHSILQLITCFTIFLWLRTYLLLPKKHIPFPLHSDDVQYGWKEIRRHKQKNKKHNDVKSTFPKLGLRSTESEPGQRGVVEVMTFKASLKSILLWTNVFHYSLVNLRVAFFSTSVLSWLRSFSNPEDISRLTDDFSFVLLFGVLVAFLTGCIIDAVKKISKSRTKDATVLNLTASLFPILITSLLSICLSVTVLLSSAYGSFVFNLLTRDFVHATNTAFIAINFPFEHFGKLYGLVCLITGLVGLLQYAIFQISLELDPTFYFINVGFLISSILSLLHPIAICLKIRSKTRQRTTRL